MRNYDYFLIQHIDLQTNAMFLTRMQSLTFVSENLQTILSGAEVRLSVRPDILYEVLVHGILCSLGDYNKYVFNNTFPPYSYPFSGVNKRGEKLTLNKLLRCIR